MPSNASLNPPFLWGTATSSHQVEGDNRLNDWWAWEQSGRVPEASGAACDHYHRFAEDFDLIQNMGHSAHRFSLEWSRIEPRENDWDENALSHYRCMLEALRARGIEPVITLHHFTNPQWFSEMGGWQRSDASEYFLRYVKRAVDALGPLARIWVTINEPLVYIYHGYMTGIWPPGQKSFGACRDVLRQFVHAHVSAYRAIHALYASRNLGPVWVSFAKHMTYLEPCRKNSIADRWPTCLRDAFFNFLFIDAVQSGFLFFPGMYCEMLSGHHALDFIGLNYYARDFIRFAGLRGGRFLGTACEKSHHPKQVREQNSLGWDIYPEGLLRILRKLKRYHLPVLITENGICTEDDAQRSRYIHDHLKALHQAREEGVQIAGYLYWSLLDNFEWDKGFKPRFGLVDMDYGSQKRTVRKSAQVLSDTCRQLFC